MPRRLATGLGGFYLQYLSGVVFGVINLTFGFESLCFDFAWPHGQ